jgi:septum formation protein
LFGGVLVEFILASGSIRRQELLERLGIDFQILVSQFDENSVPYKGDPESYVKTLALEKARNILNDETHNSFILGADTVVCVKGEILGKPENREDAFSMMKSLQDNAHEVYSGLALIHESERICETASIKTSVQFSPMTDEEISQYLDRNEWQDKAGAYGIQGAAGLFIEGIKGDYYNVMGLPLNTLYKILKKYQIIM